MALFSRAGLDRFIIGEEIARGGMAIVHRGERRADGSPVAIKLITPQHTVLAEHLEAVFQKGSEGEIALSLRHPNVVRTFEYGKKGKQYYIVMEFIDGPDLKRLINAGDPLWCENRYPLLMAAGRGLHYIHTNNLVHRDFCPKNILVEEDGTPRIIDFGLAIPAQLKAEWRFDRSGTASYMSPEQVRGLPVDTRADIYAFGVTGYEILTGQRPYPQPKSRQARMAGHLNLEPTPLRKHDPEVPIPVEHIIMRCIAKNAERRYKTMQEVVQALGHVYSTFLRF